MGNPAGYVGAKVLAHEHGVSVRSVLRLARNAGLATARNPFDRRELLIPRRAFLEIIAKRAQGEV